jgi:hypothetical protein
VNREELVQLRDAIDMALGLPDSIRELLAQWLTPAAAKPNGPRSSSPCAHVATKNGQGPGCAPREANLGEARRTQAHRRDAEQSGPLRDRAGQCGGRQPIDDRRAIAAIGGERAVEKDVTGRWKLKGEGPRPIASREDPRSLEARPG